MQARHGPVTVLVRFSECHWETGKAEKSMTLSQENCLFYKKHLYKIGIVRTTLSLLKSEFFYTFIVEEAENGIFMRQHI